MLPDQESLGPDIPGGQLQPPEQSLPDSGHLRRLVDPAQHTSDTRLSLMSGKHPLGPALLGGDGAALGPRWCPEPLDTAEGAKRCRIEDVRQTRQHLGESELEMRSAGDPEEFGSGGCPVGLGLLGGEPIQVDQLVAMPSVLGEAGMKTLHEHEVRRRQPPEAARCHWVAGWNGLARIPLGISPIREIA